MFALRGIAVSLTFFVLIYCLLSALIAGTWHWLKRWKVSEKMLADLLFALRILPTAFSILLTLVFVVPSFQLLEPHSTNERIGALPFILGICAVFLIAFGFVRMIAAQIKTSLLVARWLKNSTPLNASGAEAPIVALLSDQEAPPIMLVGIRKAQVLVSDATLELLNPDELCIALKHELAHIRSRDNLKKLVFRFCPFPGMSKLEAAWSEATELAADGAAVSKLNDAVDLAAALVKLSRLMPVETPAVCTVGFVTGSIRERVARLLAWSEIDSAELNRSRLRPYVVCGILASLFALVFIYGPALMLTHEITEWLVR
jgi:Zn-dependent protease with chaperone function